MNSKICQVSDRGTITIPASVRQKVNSKIYTCSVDKNGNIILEPVQTRDEFFADLEKTEKEWNKNKKGYSIKEMRKRYNLNK